MSDSKGRIVSLDYGKKRTGIAVSDPLQIIASPLETVGTESLVWRLKQYVAAEPVTLFLIGYPLNLDDSPTDATPLVDKFIPKLQRVFPAIPVVRTDERFSSKWASEEILKMGLSKSRRREKGLIDAVSACLLLQEYLQNRP